MKRKILYFIVPIILVAMIVIAVTGRKSETTEKAEIPPENVISEEDFSAVFEENVDEDISGDAEKDAVDGIKEDVKEDVKEEVKEDVKEDIKEDVTQEDSKKEEPKQEETTEDTNSNFSVEEDTEKGFGPIM